ncbi:hypothetical protein KZ829_39000 [Actinoplanes hulinensis]|uniref:Methylamine utilisation protein MauE domain-containing protein n=1 Tax=Actinoplanes hulinensis TaxID=1144547 RepID=A0ABS7BFR9_9ACTN|nr:MauE/DoxX family redox-associated membrane protein [Actinoplanes hulinensis]MBW6439735.1 hypothetical protein [Actinoplanes hulinensis]
MAYVAIAGRCLIGVVFLWAVVGKLHPRSAFHSFAASIQELPGMSGRNPRAVAGLVVTTEAAVTLLLMSGTTALAGLGLAWVLLAAFVVVIAAALRRGAAAPCRCFGTAVVPLSRRHLIRNGLLIVVTSAAAVGAAGSGSALPAGILVAIPAGVLGAFVLVFFDDIVGLFADQPSRRSAVTPGRPG